MTSKTYYNEKEYMNFILNEGLKRKPRVKIKKDKVINKSLKYKNKLIREIDTPLKIYNHRPKWFITKQGRGIIPSPMENLIITILNRYNIKYYCEVSFEGLQTGTTNQSLLRFDFWIPSKDIIIEYDGKQWHSGKYQKKKDNRKNEFCKAYNIKMIRLTSKDIPQLEFKIHEILK